MLNLPPTLTPSELLYCEELPPFIDELLRSSRSLRREGRLSEAERCLFDVIGASQGTSANVSQAMALIHLADVHRDMGKLGPALTECQKAHPIFQRHPSRDQRHSEAVAAYALGLVHQLLGSEMDALKWYQEAGQLFDRAKEYWVTFSASDRVETCTRVQRWMEALTRYITIVRTHAYTILNARISVPVIFTEGEKDKFAVAELGIDEYIIGRELTINGKPFCVQPVTGNDHVSLEPGVEPYALYIPSEVYEPLGANEGDLALVVPAKSASKPDTDMLERLSEAQEGSFVRDIDGGRIYFIRPVPRVIGSGDIQEGQQIGYIAALLKPT